MTSTVLVADLKGNIFGCNTYLPSLIAIDFVTCEVIVVVVVVGGGGGEGEGSAPPPLPAPEDRKKKRPVMYYIDRVKYQRFLFRVPQ